MSKNKHNKRKNTALLYECVLKQITLELLEENNDKVKKLTNVIKKYLKSGILKKELSLYKELYENTQMDRKDAEKLIERTLQQYNSLDLKQLTFKRNEFINALEKIDNNITNNFIPNYKNMATIYQLFSSNNSIKNKILLENKLIDVLTSEEEKKQKMNLEEVDNLVYKNFVKKFNEKYSTVLNESQNKTLKHFLFFSEDKPTPAKDFISKEIKYIKENVNEFLKQDINAIEKENANKILDLLNEYKDKKEINDFDLINLLEFQELSKEIQNEYHI